jgi:ABC-type transport system substrate-binding protein
VVTVATMSRSRHIPRAVALSALIALPLIALGIVAAASVKTVPASGGTVTVDMASTSSFINPLLASSDTDRGIASLVFPGLLAYGPSGSLTTDLAAAWSSVKGTTLTFDLRPGLRWQDGKPLTSADVAYTYRLLASPSFPTHTSEWTGARVSTPNALTVVVRLPHPDYTFPDEATIGIVPNHFARSATPVGAGYFAFSTASPGKVRLRVASIQGSAPAELKSLMFLTHPLSAQAGADLSCRDSFGPPTPTGSVPVTRMLGLVLDVKTVPRTAVRRALVAALAQSPNGVLAGLSTPAPTWPPAPVPFALGHPRSPAQILGARGWKLRGGTWKRGKTAIRLSLVAATDSLETPIINAVAGTWRKAGFAVAVRRLPFPSLIRAVLYPGDFKAAIVEWDFGGPDYAPGVFWERNAPLNFGRERDALVNRLSRELPRTSSFGKRNALRTAIGLRLLAVGAGVGLAPESYQCRVGKRLHGFQAPALVTDAGGLLESAPGWYVDTKLALRNPF